MMSITHRLNENYHYMLRAAVCFAVAVMLLAGCGGDTADGSDSGFGQGSQTASTVEAASTAATDGASSGNPIDANASIGAGGYMYITHGTVIEMDAPAAAALASLGEPLSYFEAASCAFGEQDKVWTYQGFRVDTYQLDGVDYIMDVVLTDDTVFTSEGVRIGDDTSAMRAAYGEPTEIGSGYAIYESGAMKLLFLLDGDTVTTIEYLSRVLD